MIFENECDISATIKKNKRTTPHKFFTTTPGKEVFKMLRIKNNFILCTVSFLFWFLSTAFDNQPHKLIYPTGPAEYVLEMKGIVSDAKSSEDSYGVKITIYVDTLVYHTQTTSHCGKCDLRFPRNGRFVVVFSKEGYLTKSISIETRVPYSVNALQKFTFSLEMFEKLSGVDMSVLKNPIAQVKFNNKKKQFDYDAEFTMSINHEIEKSYRDYYLFASQTK